MWILNTLLLLFQLSISKGEIILRDGPLVKGNISQAYLRLRSLISNVGFPWETLNPGRFINPVSFLEGPRMVFVEVP